MGFLIVAFGGAFGAMARYGAYLLAARWLGVGFPWGTLAVNLVGCLALGFVVESGMRSEALSPQTRLLLGTGFLGAFTTFSTFGVDTLRALESGLWITAGASVAANVVGGLSLAALGVALAKMAG